jgi:hypothetical protein
MTSLPTGSECQFDGGRSRCKALLMIPVAPGANDHCAVARETLIPALVACLITGRVRLLLLLLLLLQ